MQSTIMSQDLTESRIQLHYAIQFIAATGAALAEPQPDYSHTALSWNPDLQGFVGTIIPGGCPFQVALEPFSLTLMILDDKDAVITDFFLHQKTMAEGLDWLKKELSNLAVDAEKVVFIDYPPDDFPDHPVAHGVPFDANQKSTRQALVNYYATTYPLLQDIVTTTKEASPVHIWPHHFDMATLISLPQIKDGEPISIGVGFSPGDRSYAEPYWYVTPWPYPDTTNLPELAGGGFWHTQHWVGAVLTASQLNSDVATDSSPIQTFLDSALTASQTLLA